MQFSRSFAAPRATVWKFWTEPACLAEWFGPTGDTSGEVYPHVLHATMELTSHESRSVPVPLLCSSTGPVLQRFRPVSKSRGIASETLHGTF